MRISDLPEGQVRPRDMRNLARWLDRTEHEIRAMDVNDVIAGIDAARKRDAEAIASLVRSITRPKPAETVHFIVDGYPVTSCCHKTPFELPADHRLTQEHTQATCPINGVTAPSFSTEVDRG